MFQKKFTWMLREAGGGLKATAGNRVKPYYHFVRFMFFSVSFQPDSCLPWQTMLKSMSAHIGHCGPKPV